MCLAIYKPEGVSIDLDHLKKGFQTNADGGGLAWSDGHGLFTDKGFFSIDPMIAAYEEHKECPMLIHFRIATHGAKTTKYCHPFTLDGGRLAVIHNGIIPIETEKGDSDTETFVRLVLSPMVEEWGVPIDDPLLKYLVENSLSGGNKMVAMDTQGEVVIFNEGRGAWDGKCWYSNSSYKSYRTVHYAGSAGPVCGHGLPYAGRYSGFDDGVVVTGSARQGAAKKEEKAVVPSGFGNHDYRPEGVMHMVAEVNRMHGWKSASRRARGVKRKKRRSKWNPFKRGDSLPEAGVGFSHENMKCPHCHTDLRDVAVWRVHCGCCSACKRHLTFSFPLTDGDMKFDADHRISQRNRLGWKAVFSKYCGSCDADLSKENFQGFDEEFYADGFCPFCGSALPIVRWDQWVEAETQEV